MATTIDPDNQWVYLDGSPVAPTTFGNIEITPEQQWLYVKGYTIHVGDTYIRFNPDTKQPDVSCYNLDIMTGGGMPFVPGAHPEYEAFYNGLTGFDKEEFKRFRRSHPTLTNQERCRCSSSTTGTPTTWECRTDYKPTPPREARASHGGVISNVSN